MDETKKKIIKILVDKDQFEDYEDLLMNKDSLFVDFINWKHEAEEGKDISIPPKIGWMTFGEVNKNDSGSIDISPRADENPSSMPRGCFMLMKDSRGEFVRVIRQDGNYFMSELFNDDLFKFFYFIDNIGADPRDNVMISEVFCQDGNTGVEIKDCMFSAEKVGFDAEDFVLSISGSVSEGDILVNEENGKKICIRKHINGTIYVCGTLENECVTRGDLLLDEWNKLITEVRKPNECIVSVDFLKRLKEEIKNNTE